MTLLLLSSDLLVASQVQGAANRLGKTVKLISTGSQALNYGNGDEVDVLIVDLSLPSIDLPALVNQLKSSQTAATRVVAFGPHVHEQRLAAARDAGCDLVVSRGQFFAQLDSILGERQ